MLRRNGQAHVLCATALVARFQHIGLLYNLAGVTEQLGAVVRQRDAAVAAREDGDAQLAFEFLYGRREVRLRNVEALSSGINRSVLADGDKVSQLLQGHDVLLN